MKVFMGIDTSCYTTSVALVDENSKLIREIRKLLPVQKGKKGLAQSQALFYHVQNYPQVIEQLFSDLNVEVCAVCASTRPRNIEGSYMPVFTFSEGMGRSFSSLLKVPFFTTSHQEGHIKAGMWSTGVNFFDEFVAVHLSGGTSEVMLVKYDKFSVEYRIKRIGWSQDLHAGQFVDRVGVSLGLDFPAGPQLEEIAKGSRDNLTIPSSVKGFKFSFSGPESHAQRLIEKGKSPHDIARAVEKCIAKTLEKVLRKAVDSLGIKKILLVGGVAANNFIRKRLQERLSHPAVGADIYFSDAKYSTDNAVGVALIGKEKFTK